MYGEVGSREQLFALKNVSYREYKAELIQAQVVSTEWFATYWDEYFLEGDVMSTDILYLIQTSLLAQTRYLLFLTVIQKYYIIAFDWVQETNLNEGSQYIYPSDFDRLIQLLECIQIPVTKIELIRRLHSASKSTTDNHRKLFWNIIRFQREER